MSDHAPVERVLGNLDGRMTVMESRMASLENQIDSRLKRLESSLDEVHAAVISARGAWRAIAWVAGIAGTLAGGLAAVAHWLMTPR